MRKDIGLVAIIVAALALMVLPLSPKIIDFLLALNISLSVLLLMVAVYLKHPSDFSTFPSVILIGTAFRLSLSIATTRLILSEGEAGDIIETFGEFVVSGSIAIGLVIFLIITVVQFVVVTKGAERVAEVGARFALDALPGKQMSIDAEVRAGSITPEDAIIKRKRLDRDSRFFGGMDGAMKFVKGDAIAGIIIISINLIGGIAVGLSAHGYSFSEAIGIYSLLTVGDGLVAQLPAILMSLCAGIIVTRADSRNGDAGQDLGSDIAGEIIADPRVQSIGAPIVLAIGFIPGFPTLIFAGFAATMFLGSIAVGRAIVRAEEEAEHQRQVNADQAELARNAPPEPLVSNRVRLKISNGLADELDREAIENKLADHLVELHAARGVLFPRPVLSFVDNGEDRNITLEIDEVPVLTETIPKAHFVIAGQDISELTPTVPSEDIISWPITGAVWIPNNYQSVLEKFGVTTSVAEEAIARIAYRKYERNLGVLFSQAVFTSVIMTAREAEPELMKSIEAEIDNASLYKMLRYLVEDGVPLRPMSLFVSSIRYWLVTLDHVTPVAMAECLRGSMKRQLCHRIAGPERILGLTILSPDLDVEIRRGLAEASSSVLDASVDGLPMTPEANERLLTPLRRIANGKTSEGRQVALVVAAELRRKLRNHLASHNIHLSVLAPHEISNEVATIPLGEIDKLPMLN